jgi:hypothetical protein
MKLDRIFHAGKILKTCRTMGAKLLEHNPTIQAIFESNPAGDLIREKRLVIPESVVIETLLSKMPKDKHIAISAVQCNADHIHVRAHFAKYLIRGFATFNLVLHQKSIDQSSQVIVFKVSNKKYGGENVAGKIASLLAPAAEWIATRGASILAGSFRHREMLNPNRNILTYSITAKTFSVDLAHLTEILKIKNMGILKYTHPRIEHCQGGLEIHADLKLNPALDLATNFVSKTFNRPIP